jgi:hypothetical protein
MSKQSEDMRSRASRELRASRRGGSEVEKADNLKRAASFKALAENEKWLAGEPSRRHTSSEAQPATSPPDGAQGGVTSQDQI